MRKIFNWLVKDGPTEDQINYYETSIRRQDYDGILINAQKLLTYFGNEKKTIGAYFDGVLDLAVQGEEMMPVALMVAAMPLSPVWPIPKDYREASIRALTDLCPIFAAQNPYNIFDAVAYLESAASNYRDYPELSSNALNTAFDMINDLSDKDLAMAARVATSFYPNETYMFKEPVAQSMEFLKQVDNRQFVFI